MTDKLEKKEQIEKKREQRNHEIGYAIGIFKLFVEYGNLQPKLRNEQDLQGYVLGAKRFIAKHDIKPEV